MAKCLVWKKTAKEDWTSTCGNYHVWVQARVREGMSLVKQYGAEYKSERPWLTDTASFWEAKEMCELHAERKAAGR